MTLRLDKYLTEAGVGTRSEVKKLVRAKQITVNGVIVTRPEAKVDEEDAVCLRGERVQYAAFEYYLFHKPAGCVCATEDRDHKTVMDYLTDTIRSDLFPVGERVQYAAFEYYLFHKPAGCVCATEDRDHKTVMDYLTDTIRSDLFPVGRLDIDTEGLLLITNDGALAHELLSPARHVAKTYFARVRGIVTDSDVNLFKNGIDIGEKKLTKPAALVILNTSAQEEEAASASEILLTITEGKFHQVKRMFAAVGKEVLYLKRLSMGPLRLDEKLRPGGYRALTEEEIAMLKNGKWEEEDE